MRVVIAVFKKIVSAVIPRRPPSGELAERAFEKAAAQFTAP